MEQPMNITTTTKTDLTDIENKLVVTCRVRERGETR